jgi:hypothetical protein
MNESNLARIERFEINLIRPKPDHAMIITFPDHRLWDSNLERFVTEQEIAEQHYQSVYYIPCNNREYGTQKKYGLSDEEMERFWGVDWRLDE